MVATMGPLARYPAPVAIMLAALAATAGVFVFARPGYHPHRGVTIALPAKPPAADAPGAAGWVWPDGTPGWQPGYTVKGFNVSGLQPVEVQAAQLAAARAGLDASGVRVLQSIRENRDGVLAIVAAPTLSQTPVGTCLGAILAGDAPVRWLCPRDLADSRVLVAAATYAWKEQGAPASSLDLAGVARGDVSRVVLDVPGTSFGEQPIYTRGTTWGQFQAAVVVPHGVATLKIYGDHGLVQTLPVNVPPGRQRVLK